MTFQKPFIRTYRPVQKENPNSGYSSWAYIIDHEYSNSPEHYTRAFLLIQEDLKKLFEYIEPSDVNLSTYSYRIHELFMRTCIEIEANFKAILKENVYTPVDKYNKPRLEDKWKISDYQKINKTHFLEEFSVEIPIWKGNRNNFHPFVEWKNNNNLSWYKAYNESKHDRQGKFALANFENLLLAITGLIVLLSSQFKTETFSPGSQSLGIGPGYSYYQGEFGIGDFFIINFPKYPEESLYDFNWSSLKNEADRFEKINFNI